MELLLGFLRQGWVSATSFDLTLVSAAVTAIATVGLCVFTWVLAKETRRLSQATAQAQVTAIIEPGMWSMLHMDIVVMNSGNAVAYDVIIDISPPVQSESIGLSTRGVPFQRISLIQPGQSLRSYLREYATLVGNTYTISISWALKPKAKRRHAITYSIDMRDFDGISSVGERNPLVQIAEQVKKMREDWERVAKGNSRLGVDAYLETDRAREQAEWEARRAEWTRRSQLSDGESPDGSKPEA